MNNTNPDNSSRADVKLFVGAFFGGLFFITICKLLSASQWVLTSLVVGIILLYGFIVWRSPRLRLRLDQAGDNAYYLGLLFTLISMAFALNAVSTDVAATGDVTSLPSSTAERIIADFGVALGSTIAGIFVRIFLQQIRIDPSDIETTTRIELAQAADLLRSELSRIAESMRSFHDVLTQSSQDLSQRLLDELTSTIAALREQVTASADSFTNELEKVAASFPPKMTNIHTRLEETGTELNQTIIKLRGATTPLTQINTRLTKVGENLVTVGDNVESITVRLSGGLDKVDQVQRRLGELVTHIEAVVQRLPERDRDLVAKMEASLRSLEVTQTSLADLNERQAAAVRVLGDQSEQSAAAVQRAQTASSDVLVALTDLTRALESRLRSAATI